MRQGTRREVLRSSHPNGNFIWRRAELWEAGTPAVPSGSQIQRTSESRALFSPGCTNLSSRHLGFCLWGWFFFGLRIVHSVRKALHCSTAQTEHDLCCCCSQRAQNWAPPVRTLCSGSALTQSWGSLSRNGSPSVSIPPGLCLKVPEKLTIRGHDVLVGWGRMALTRLKTLPKPCKEPIVHAELPRMLSMLNFYKLLPKLLLEGVKCCKKNLISGTTCNVIRPKMLEQNISFSTLCQRSSSEGSKTR